MLVTLPPDDAPPPLLPPPQAARASGSVSAAAVATRTVRDRDTSRAMECPPPRATSRRTAPPVSRSPVGDAGGAPDRLSMRIDDARGTIGSASGAVPRPTSARARCGIEDGAPLREGRCHEVDRGGRVAGRGIEEPEQRLHRPPRDVPRFARDVRDGRL